MNGGKSLPVLLIITASACGKTPGGARRCEWVGCVERERRDGETATFRKWKYGGVWDERRPKEFQDQRLWFVFVFLAFA